MAKGTDIGSAGSYPARTLNINARSSTRRAIGPVDVPRANGPTAAAGNCPEPGMRPGVGFNPAIPQKCAGIRIDPPISDPTPAAEHPEAIAAASPPDDPPGTRDKLKGLLV